MKKKTIRDVELRGKRVLLRVDYNVQVSDGRIVDDLRLVESLPTIRALREAGACTVIISHRGRTPLSPLGACINLYDNVTFNTVPAPGAAALLGLSGAVMFRRRRS